MRLSAIIPAYNVDQYISDCIDSLLCQNIDIEIIIINDGSSDKTGDIAERYKNENENIKIIHQAHSGPSVARNRGLEIATGEYIAFIDSDDWITEGVLTKLYNIAIENQADMVMGNITFNYPDASESNMFSISSHLKNRMFTGAQCFISFMEAHCYYPMAVSYIYRHEWIKKNNLRFEAGIFHEDELWTPIALCMADCVVLTDFDFYHYRKQEGSIMHTLKREIRLHGYFHVMVRLTLFASKYEDTGEEGILKCWMYVNIYRIFKTVCEIVSMINDSRFSIPNNDIVDRYNQLEKFMPLKAKERCEDYYLVIKASEDKYLRWRNNPWDKHICQLREQELLEKKMILVYNLPEWYDHELLTIDKLPSDYVITFDRKYLNQAYAVVFHLPDLSDCLDGDLEKPENHIWIAWSIEDEENDPWAEDEDFGCLFDIWMVYQNISDNAYSYYTDFREGEIPVNIDLSKENTGPFVNLCHVLSMDYCK